MKITVRYTSIDRARIVRRFGSLKSARAFAVSYVGSCPDLGVGYAVSGDGVGKITVDGVSTHDLFHAPLVDAPEMVQLHNDDPDAPIEFAPKSECKQIPVDGEWDCRPDGTGVLREMFGWVRKTTLLYNSAEADKMWSDWRASTTSDDEIPF